MKPLAIVIEPELQPLSPSIGQGLGPQVPTPSYHKIDLLARSPQQYLLLKVALLIQTQVPLSLHHLGNYKGFQSSLSETGMKTKCVFLIINHKALIV